MGLLERIGVGGGISRLEVCVSVPPDLGVVYLTPTTSLYLSARYVYCCDDSDSRGFGRKASLDFLHGRRVDGTRDTGKRNGLLQKPRWLTSPICRTEGDSPGFPALASIHSTFYGSSDGRLVHSWTHTTRAERVPGWAPLGGDWETCWP